MNLFRFTKLPVSFAHIFKSMPQQLTGKHSLVLKWLILLHIILVGKWNLAHLAKAGAKHITEWKFRRLLNAKYWDIHTFIYWAAREALMKFPPPTDFTIYAIVDGSTKDKRGQKGPVSQKGKTSKHGAYFFGYKFVVLMLAWDGYRIPVDFALVLPKNHPEYKTENQLFREMLQRLPDKLPEWAKTVVVIGDAGYASKENMRTIKKLGSKDPHHVWGFVFALPKNWKLSNGQQKLLDLVKHTAKKYFQRTYIPPISKGRKGRSFYIFGKRTSLAHLGEVTIVLSRKGPNGSPKKTKALVTNLPELSYRKVLMIYKRRWPIEILFKELKSGLGLGQHQVTRSEDRIRKSVGISIISYLILIRIRSQDIKPNMPWSIFQLKQNFTLDFYHEQSEHNFQLELKKYAKAA